MDTPASDGSATGERTPVDHLRALVVGLRERGRQRRIPTGLSVALLDGDRGRVDATEDLLAPLLDGPDPHTDRGPLPYPLRVDLIARGLATLDPAGGRLRLVTGDRPPSTPETVGAAFLLRGGGIELASEDLAWWRAFQAGCGVLGVPPGELYAVTRYGWVDVRHERAVRVPRLRRVEGDPR